MKLLHLIDQKDYDENLPSRRREAVRAVIFVDGKLALIQSKMYGECKFIGGGIEENETHIEVLLREAKEEAGFKIIPSSIKEFGMTVEKHQDNFYENSVFEQNSYYYFCEIDKSVVLETNLDDYEMEYGFELKFFTIDDAIANNEKLIGTGEPYWTKRDLLVFKYLKENLTRAYFVRHAQSDHSIHDDKIRPLTEKGLNDSLRVTDFLQDKNINAIYCSPYKRSIDTILDFAEKHNLKINTVDDFRERQVDSVWIPDFESFSRMQWDDFNYKLNDGESLSEVQLRNVLALNNILGLHKGENIVVGTHGTALSTICNFYDHAFNYNSFSQIVEVLPWIVKMTFCENICIEFESVENISE